jgi:hypothetical protein
MESRMKIYLRDEQYTVVKWEITKDADHWVLKTHDDCVRVLDRSWALVVPRVRTIAENYNMKLVTNIG